MARQVSANTRPARGARYGCRPFLHEVGAGVQGDANEKGVATHSPSQKGLGCSGSPRGTRKRKPVKPGEPALGEDPFIFDMFSQLAAAAAANLRNVQLESRIPVPSLAI